MESWKTSANVSKPCTACFLLREMPPTDTSGHQVCCVPSDAATVWSLKATRPFTKKISTESTSRQFQCVFFYRVFWLFPIFWTTPNSSKSVVFCFFAPPQVPFSVPFPLGDPPGFCDIVMVGRSPLIFRILQVASDFNSGLDRACITTTFYGPYIQSPHSPVWATSDGQGNAIVSCTPWRG